MVKDKRSNVVIVSSSRTANTRTIEGYRPLDNCNDQDEDIYLEGKGDYKRTALGSVDCFSASHDQFSELD